MSETVPPEFVVAAAKDIQQKEALYWPSQDYPDREEWLRRRAAQREKPPVQRIYSGRQPLALGINVAKRRAVTEAGSPNPKKNLKRSMIVKHRHQYYRDRYGVKS